MSHTRRVAFTLIEILTVIAIISILAAMLLPSFSRAREMARKTSCLSNMKQLGLGFLQYTQDYDERFPGAGQYQRWANGGHWIAAPASNPVNATTIGKPNSLAYVDPADGPVGEARGTRAGVERGALFSYTKDARIYICPSNKDGEVKGLTYSMNCNFAGLSQAALQDDSLIVLLLDEDKANDGFLYTGSLSTDALTQIHNGGGNLLMADGHAKFYPFGRFPLNAADAAGLRDPLKIPSEIASNSPRLLIDASSSARDNGFGSCNAP